MKRNELEDFSFEDELAEPDDQMYHLMCRILTLGFIIVAVSGYLLLSKQVTEDYEKENTNAAIGKKHDERVSRL